MFSILKNDLQAFREALKGQDSLFYLGLAFIVLYYLRPQYIFPQLNFLPWLKITILAGFAIMVVNSRLKVTGAHLLVLVFAALAWVSAIYALYPEISTATSTTPLIFALEVLFLSNCVKDTKQLKLLLIVFFLCIFKMSFFGARTWTMRGFGFTGWGIQGPAGFFQNSGEFSLLMAICTVMSIPLIVYMKSKTKFYWVLPITTIMTVIGASSRGGQLALVVGLIYLLLAYKKIRIKNLLYVAIFATVVWSIFPEEQKARFQSAGEDNTSTSRLGYWAAGIDMVEQYPWLGVGYEGFPEQYHRYYKEEDPGSFFSYRREVAHNSLVQVASSVGLPALALYLIMHLLVYSRKPPKYNAKTANDDEMFLEGIRLALNASVITYFVGAFFMSVAFYPYLYFLLSLAIIRSSLLKRVVVGSTTQRHSTDMRKHRYQI